MSTIGEMVLHAAFFVSKTYAVNKIKSSMRALNTESSQRRDLDPRPSDYKSDALARLSYVGMRLWVLEGGLKCCHTW